MYVAVDLGASNLRAAKADEDGNLLAFEKISISSLKSGEEITSRIITLIEKLFPKDSPKAIGISTAGPVNKKTGEVVHSPNMHCDRIQLIEPLRIHFGCPVAFATDCKAAVLAEYTAKPADTLVYITFSTGVGAGVISGGHLFEGADGNACEIGHLIVDTKYNLPCGCGKSGHLEAYTGGANIPHFFRIFSGKTVASTADIFSAAENGEKISRDFIDELARICGRGISNIIAAYNPDKIILDGPLVQENPWFVEKIISCTDTYLSMPEISLSKLQGRAPLLGAVLLAKAAK
ncbi:MAG TPA: ROK family protein [Methanocorpusculum sp.]|nr:ROK family protein [Methanocorpusculum sp.]